VSEIAVAVLDVDEREAGVPRLFGRGHEPVDEAIEIVVAHHRQAGGEAAIQQRMRVRDARLGTPFHRRLCVASRVRELQADVEIAVRVRAEGLAVRGHERFAQRREIRLRRVGDDELVRIRAAVELDGDRLAAPDQFRAAQPEPLPAPPRQVARPPVARAVPALHREDAEPVARARAVQLERPRERRRRGWIERLVECDPRAALPQVLPKRRRRFE
jgi:hypothetical protein